MKYGRCLVYVAGPYRASTEFGVVENIRAAERVALRVWELGCACLCPHKNTAFFGGAHGLDDRVWLDGDLVMLRRCDAVVLVPGWETSAGTRAEIDQAAASGLPVFASVEQLAQWLEKEWRA